MSSTVLLFLTVALSNGILQLSLAVGDNFYFSVQPKSHSVIAGRNTTLECDVSSRQNVVFSWTLNGKPVTNTTRRYQHRTSLVFVQVDEQLDFGEFRCNAMNISSGFSLDSLAAELDVLWIGNSASVILHSSDSGSDLSTGSDIVLRCDAEGNPDIHVEWYLNGIRLFRNSRVFVNGKRLEIVNISASDNGIYACRAENNASAVDSSKNFALTLNDSDYAHILQLPQDAIVRRSDSVYFHCVYENAVTTEWYGRDDSRPLRNSSRMTLFSNGTLYIHKVRNSDEGQYRCVGKSKIVSKSPSYVAELKIATIEQNDKDVFVPHTAATEPIVIAQGLHFEVICQRPKGYPLPKVWWEDKQNKVISDSGRIRVYDTTLIIDDAQPADSGNYSCVAENSAGLRKTAILIYVATPPAIMKSPVGQTADEGSRVEFTCLYSGAPYPHTVASWNRVDHEMIESDSFRVFVFPHNATLVLDDVQMVDSGEYFCEVNTTGFASAKSNLARLEVKEKLKFFPVPVNRKLELGSQSKIYCKARGSDTPVVHWSKEGQLTRSEWPSRIREDENGTLHFDAVTTEDAGRYTCAARSAQGYINATIQVDVIVTAKIIVQPTNTEALEGQSAIIHCKAYGDPLPNIQWDKNSVLNNFDPHRFEVLENGSLFINKVHVTDQGKYGCTVGNSGGFKREEMLLTIKALVPDVSLGDSDEEKREENVTTKTLVITLGASSAYMVLVIGLMIWCRYRRAKQKASYVEQAAAAAAAAEDCATQLNKIENGEVPHHAADGREMQCRNRQNYKDISLKSDGEIQSGHVSSHSRNSCTSYDKLLFSRRDLHMIMLLGKSSFGEVLLAKADGIKDGEAETVVMVKSLHSRDECDHVSFKRELDMYYKLKHKNIAQLLGICKDTEPFFMIMEYTDWGDLKQYLLATRKDNPCKRPQPSKLTLSQIVCICDQIALGMEFLSNSRFIHKDLASRNCLVTSALDVKISSPSLSKDTYSTDYHRIYGRLIPVRWLPHEAIFEDEFSTKSDVWSFAVLVWEIFAQGDLPFADFSDDVFVTKIKAKELDWIMPSHCPKQLISVLNQCWMESPKDRPCFGDIVSQIEKIQVDSNV